MNFVKSYPCTIFLVILLVITGCASSGGMYSIDEELTLRSHLMRNRSVEFSGDRVYITNASLGSFSGNMLEPMFIIDGTDVGHGFANAENQISGRIIKSVEVYRPSQSGRWGGRGAHGVIVVKTKTQSDSESDSDS